MKHEQLANKHALGSFCEQFDYEPMTKKKHHHKSGQKCSRKQYKKNYKPIKQEKRATFRSRKQKPFKKSQTNIVTCFKCGKVGHCAKECKIKRKINEIQIDGEDL